MFVQVIQGQVSDAEQVHAALDRWVEGIAPDASGWLGTTAGVTDDGQFIALARFQSAAAAQGNSDRRVRAVQREGHPHDAVELQAMSLPEAELRRRP